MIVIKNVEELRKNREYIEKISNRNIKNFQLCYENLYALHKFNSEIVTLIDDFKKYYTCFKKKNDNIMECCINIEPISYKKDITEIENFIKEIYSYFRKKTLYFPLVYENSEFNKLLLKDKKICRYKRLYTSIVEPKKIKDLFTYIGNNKYFSINAVKKFKKKLYIKYFSKEDVENILSIIEQESWKNKFGKDLYTNYNKLLYYNELIYQGVAQIVVAFYDKMPVAYRIDAIKNNIVTQLKTSFSEKYKKYSPGAYLTIYDMYNNFKNFDSIDLYGSPNLLKNLIETKRIERFDFCYGDKNIINELKLERQEWDMRNFKIFKEGYGIKKVYEKVE